MTASCLESLSLWSELSALYGVAKSIAGGNRDCEIREAQPFPDIAWRPVLENSSRKSKSLEEFSQGYEASLSVSLCFVIV